MRKKTATEKREKQIDRLNQSALAIGFADASRIKKQAEHDPLFDIAGDWVWEIDRNGIFSYASPRIRDFLGYDRQEVEGKPANNFMSLKEAKRMLAYFEEASKQQEPSFRFENTQIHKDGREVLIETSGTPVFGPRGNLLGWRGINRDITERKHAERALIESESKFRLLFDGAVNSICLLDKKGNFMLVNQTMAKILGGDPHQFIGKSIYQIFPEHANTLKEKHLQVMESGEGIEFEIRHETAIGNKWFLSTISPMKNANDKITAFQHIFYDITERKIAEKRITQQAQEILELSTPVIQVWEGIVIAPLIGMLDSQRTQGFMERFLDNIVATKSPLALVDITGVPTVDTQTAQHLIEAITAARLLGTKVVLTGVRPIIAQTLVHLGIDLSEIETCASLASGFRRAMDMLGLRVIKDETNPSNFPMNSKTGVRDDPGQYIGY